MRVEKWRNDTDLVETVEATDELLTFLATTSFDALPFGAYTKEGVAKILEDGFLWWTRENGEAFYYRKAEA